MLDELNKLMADSMLIRAMVIYATFVFMVAIARLAFRVAENDFTIRIAPRRSTGAKQKGSRVKMPSLSYREYSELKADKTEALASVGRNE